HAAFEAKLGRQRADPPAWRLTSAGVVVLGGGGDLADVVVGRARRELADVQHGVAPASSTPCIRASSDPFRERFLTRVPNHRPFRFAEVASLCQWMRVCGSVDGGVRRWCGRAASLRVRWVRRASAGGRARVGGGGGRAGGRRRWCG